MGYSVIELFAGAGGLALGLENAGLKTILLNEIDKDCVATLKKNRPDWNVMQWDIRDIDFTGFKADVVTGGFPCQPFSIAGKRLGFEDTRGTLFFEFARCIKEVKPKIFLAENVSGLKSHNNGETLNTIINILKDIGYDVQYDILNAVDYLVPQNRRRLIIVGTLPGITFNFPKKQNKIITLKEALQNVPQSKGGVFSDHRKELFSILPTLKEWNNMTNVQRKEYLQKISCNKYKQKIILRRYEWNKPSSTLVTRIDSGFTARWHPDELRFLTIRECARIQTFPDDWIFEGSIYSQYRQIGNAVPVKLAEFLGYEIINALNNEKKEVNNTISIIIENYKIELSQKTKTGSGKYLFFGHYEPVNSYSIYINNNLFSSQIKQKNLKEQLNRVIEDVKTEIEIKKRLAIE